MYLRQILNNGLTLVSESIREAHIVSIGFFFKFGSQNERRDNNGIFHLFEHAFGRNINAIANARYAKYNAITTKEYLCFFVKCVKCDYVDCIRDIVNAFREESILSSIEESEKIVEKEIVLKSGNEQYKMDNLLFEIFFDKDSLSFPTEGCLQNIKNFSNEELQYVRRLFNPINCIISLVGGIENDNNNCMKSILEAWKPDIKIDDLLPINLSNDMKIEHYRGKNLGISMCIGQYHIQDYNEEVKLRILNEILGGNSNSKFFLNIRQKKKLCYYLYSSLLYFNRISTIYLHIDTCESEADLLIDEIFKIVNNDELSEREIGDAKSRLKNNVLFNYESTSSIMTRNAVEVLHDNNHVTVEEYTEIVNQTKEKDLYLLYDHLQNVRTSVIFSDE